MAPKLEMPSESPFLCIGQMMAKRLSVVATTVDRELAKSSAKGSAKKISKTAYHL